jgi:hypothetical protein
VVCPIQLDQWWSLCQWVPSDAGASSSIWHACMAAAWHIYYLRVCGDVGREVIWLTHFQGQSQRQGPYLLTPYTHGVPHVDCEGPCALTRTNPLLVTYVSHASPVLCVVHDAPWLVMAAGVGCVHPLYVSQLAFLTRLCTALGCTIKCEEMLPASHCNRKFS